MNTQTIVISNSIPNNASNNANLKVELTAFVQKSLADSYSQDLEDALQLLDVAWEAQKMLWQLRDDTEI
jgi:hypothetical protein